MNNNLPAKQGNSLFEKIRNLFRKIFFKEKIEENHEEKIEIQSEIEKEDNVKKRFEESIRSENNNDYINEMKREKFLDDIDEMPESLYNLPVEKLEKLENYYKESIKKYENRLANIKNAS